MIPRTWWVAAVGVALAVTFAVAQPPVPDLWAARAREYAAEHGVGLTYWFSWFGGTVPGHYSVLLPYAGRAVGSVTLLVVFGTLASGLLVPALRGARFGAWPVGAAALAVGCNVWSGRVAFVAGTAVALGVVLAVRHARTITAAVLTALACAVTPVAGAFLALGLLGVVVFDHTRRRAAIAAVVAAVAALGVLAAVFGSPGPEGFRTQDLVTSMFGLAALLLLRPERRVALMLWLSLPLCLGLGLIDNGLGSNFQRMVWFVLPVACLATSQARRRWVALVAVVPLGLGVAQTVRDLHTADDPLSSAAAYRGAAAFLAHQPDRADHRVEVVPNGTYTAAFALLNDGQLARGFETQSDKLYDSSLTQSALPVAVLRHWLDDNAVGWVVLTRRTLTPQSTEDALVRRHRPDFLRPVYSDTLLTIFAVRDATPIVAVPGRVVSASPAVLVLSLPPTTGLLVRVHWSRFLTLHDAPRGTRMAESPDGWLLVSAPRRCTCRLTG